MSCHRCKLLVNGERPFTFYNSSCLSKEKNNNKDLLPPNQLVQIATQLIQSMTAELVNLPPVTTTQARQKSTGSNSSNHSTQESDEGTDGDNDESSLVLSQKDATQSLDRQLVACYCFQSLLRLNQSAQSQIGLVAPLWKGICNVHKVTSIPSALLEQAIQQVLKMLKEGCFRFTSSLVVASQQLNKINNNNDILASFVMQGKLISFLALRLSNLMGSCHGSKKARSKAYRHLLLLQGMDLATHGQAILPQPFQKTCKEIATKTTKALVEMIVDKRDNVSVIHRPALDALIPIAMPILKDGNDGNAELSYRGLHLAKVQLSIAILEKFAVENTECLIENMDALLMLCEGLYSIFLPQCYGLLLQSLWWQDCTMARNFVDSCLEPLATVLVRIDAALSPSVASKQLHRLLVRWLGPYRSNELHPLSRAVILIVMHLFLMSSLNRELFVSLIVKLLFDPRTETSLRQNLSALLVTILASSNKSNTSLRALVLGRIETEVQKLIPKASKKRRRSEKDFSLKHYSFEDLKATIAVLVHLSETSHRLVEAMQKLVQQLQGGKENPQSIPEIIKVE